MAKNETLVSVKNLFSSEQNKNLEKEITEILMQEDIPIICVNREQQKKRLMPFSSLYGNGSRFWQQKHSWSYYISEECNKKIEELTNTKPVNWDVDIHPNVPENDTNESINNSEETPDLSFHLDLLNQLTANKTNNSSSSNTSVSNTGSCAVSKPLNHSDEVGNIDYHVNLLNQLIANKTKDPKIISGVLVNAVRDTAIINRNIIMGAIQYPNIEAKNLTQNLVKSTIEMVKISSYFQMENTFQNELINTLVQKRECPIVKHMIRVYLQGIAFLEFYNKLMSSSYAVSRLRIEFKEKYFPFYAALLPHLDPSQITLERVFYKGMRAIQPNMFYNWALGLLIHDIGKDASVEYNEGEANYIRSNAVDHVKLGISSITNKTNYCREAAIITGYHHDYYNKGGSYGVYYNYSLNFKKNNPGKSQDFCIGFDLENLLKCEVLGYFPAKVLEIIDIYDSLTDTNRIHSKVLNHNEAINKMWNEYIINQRMLDPILFNIFVTFKNIRK
ncbi:MAG: hypothetical protein FWD47_09785 [Treponema sp.]|nr:hypothetical protein [Treponema sp.]